MLIFNDTTDENVKVAHYECGGYNYKITLKIYPLLGMHKTIVTTAEGDSVTGFYSDKSKSIKAAEEFISKVC